VYDSGREEINCSCYSTLLCIESLYPYVHCHFPALQRWFPGSLPQELNLCPGRLHRGAFQLGRSGDSDRHATTTPSGAGGKYNRCTREPTVKDAVCLCKHLLSGRVSLIYFIAGTALNTGLIGVLCPQGVYPIHWGRVTGTFCPQGVPLSVQ
jgi:hypothetical protein